MRVNTPTASLASSQSTEPRISRSCAVERLEDRRLFAAGDLDLTFGAGAGAFGAGGSFQSANVFASAVQPDGKLLVAGGYDDFHVYRYAADGSPDPTFGNGGQVVTDLFGGMDDPAAVLVQPDGKLLVIGNTAGAPGERFQMAVVRYNPDGSLDASFGNGGKAVADFDGGSMAGAAALDAQGRILVGGLIIGADTDPRLFGVARFLPDGSLDRSFGEDGAAKLSFGQGDFVEDIAVQSDGRIVLAGTTLGHYDEPLDHDLTIVGFALARLTPDGRPDPTFGDAGQVLTPLPGGGRATDVEILPDGRILVAGGSLNGDMVLGRYTAAGALDPSFGNGGLAMPFDNVDFGANAMSVQADGRILVTGPCSGRSDPAGLSDFAVARLLSDGTADTAFGAGGLTTSNFGNYDYPMGVHVAPDGAILVAGQSDGRIVVARYDGGPPQQLTAAVDGKATVRSGRFYSFKVTYRSADAAFDAALMAGGPITVVGPDGFESAAQLLRVKSSRHGHQVVMAYRLPAPGGRFDAADNGTYTITGGPAAAAVAAGGAALSRRLAVGGGSSGALGQFRVAAAPPHRAAVVRLAGPKRRKTIHH